MKNQIDLEKARPLIIICPRVPSKANGTIFRNVLSLLMDW